MIEEDAEVRSDARLSQGGQHVMLVSVSLSLAYLIAFLTFMNQWINFWLRGSYYFSYQGMFLTLLLILFLVRLRRHCVEQRRNSWICRRLNRVSPASDFPGERSSASIDNAPIPGTRSGDCVLVVSRETPELALRRHHRTGDGRHQSAVRHTLAWALVSTTFQFACGTPAMRKVSVINMGG